MPGGADQIPQDLVSAIASSTAMSVGEQPAILANLALANLIANTNLAQQNAISNQQAMFHLQLTIVSKCVELIASISPASASATQQLEAYQKVMEMLAQSGKTSSDAVSAQAPAAAAAAAAQATPAAGPPPPQPPPGPSPGGPVTPQTARTPSPPRKAKT
ncbi:MAG TPA: hypothetical protein VGX92_07780 [Pyrinomonadaceae bacterium]|jgi:DNA-binding protein H-NS|nr:hypothetical protein [Pyrinomonadaceae bacterium]